MSALTFTSVTSLVALVLPLQETELGRLVRDRYVKSEHRVPMRDGVHLFTAVYRPREVSSPLPILIVRTPYGIAPYGEDRFNPWFLGPSEIEEHLRDGYLFVYQDVRGRMMSEGDFVHMRPLATKEGTTDERTDTWDTIEWLLENVPGHDGHVGVWGGSYDGFYATCAALGGHPALEAVLIQGPQTDWYFEDFHRHGILCLADAFDFLSVWGWPHGNPTSEPPRAYDPGARDGYRFFLDLGAPAELDRRHFRGRVAFWKDLVAHPDRDAFWRARDVLPRVHEVRPAVLVVGGWYDHNNLRGSLAIYRALRRGEPSVPPRLVIGPWVHAGWQNPEERRLGTLDFGQPTAAQYHRNHEVPFLRARLRKNEVPLPEARAHAFDTGTLEWRSFEEWPPPDRSSRMLHLAAEGRLASGSSLEVEGSPSDELVSDPAAPVPAWIEPSLGVPETYVSEDQRFVEGRPDVLVYRTEPLARALTVAGPIEVELWISSEDAQDAALVVKLIDEAPRVDGEATGEARLVRWGAMTARHREDFDRPRPLPPGEVVPVRFELLDVLHTFRPGHRLQIQIQPSLFPILMRQPHAWVANPLLATREDYSKATVHLHRSAEHSSRVQLGALSQQSGDQQR